MRRLLKTAWFDQILLWVPRHTILVPASLGAVMIAIMLTAWLTIPTRETQGHVIDAQRNIENFAARLETHILTRLALAEQVQHSLAGGQITTKSGFLAQTSYIHELFTDFQAISWVDSEGIIRWVSPLEGNEETQDLNIRALPGPAAALAAAETTGKLQITPPIDLAQGGGGFVAYLPVLKLSPTAGFLAIVFHIEPLMTSALPGGLLEQYDVMIMDGRNRVYGSIDTMAGRIEGSSKTIALGNRTWTLTLLPTASTLAAYETWVDEIILCILIFLSIAIAWLVRLAMVHQQRLHASDKLFRTFIEYSPSAIFIKEPDGHYLHVNTRWHEWFNPEGKDITGKTMLEFFPKAHSKVTMDMENTVLRDAVPVERETVSLHADGTYVPALFQKFPIFDNQGNIIAIGGMNTDISARKRAEEILHLALIKAEGANQSKSKFLATMSHELRTPLNAIIGFSDILIGEYFGAIGNARYTEYVKDINHSGRQLLTLINEVLDISAIELGRRKLVLGPVPVEPLLNDCVKTVSLRARERRIQLAVKVKAALPVIEAEESAMRQIFTNLLTNAIKFSHPGDTVTISANADEKNIVVAFADTGYGINKSTLASVTEPFVKGHNNPDTTDEGVGLGLSIVKSFVAAHKGALHIESEIGTGTTVSVTFPRNCGAQIIEAGHKTEIKSAAV